MSVCKHCSAPIVWARNDNDTRWLRPLEVEAKVAEPTTGHVLIVQIDGEWRSVPKVRQHAFHVCPEPEPVGEIPFADETTGEVLEDEDTERPPPQKPRRQHVEEAAERAERAQSIRLLERDQRQIERHWSSPRRVEIMGFDCPTCTAKAGEPCRGLQAAEYSRLYGQSYLNQPHPERTALAPPFMPPWKVRKAALEAERKVHKHHIPVETPMDLKTSGIKEKDIHLLRNWVRQHGALFLDLETPDDE